MGKSETEAMRNKLVEDGFGSYLDALAAVREFQKAVIERSRRALEQKLNDLSKAMGIKREEIKDYTDPAKLTNEELGKEGWVGIEFSNKPVLYCHFGLCFEREDSKCVTKVVVSMWTDNVSRRDFLLEHCKKVSRDFDNYDGYNIGLFMPITKDEINNFEAKLQELIDKWIEVWERVGGIKKLPEV